MNPLRDQFAYLLADDVDGDAVASVTVTLTVAGADRVPPALDDSFTISENDTAVVLTVMANDELGDPLVAREHIAEFNWASSAELDLINNQCLKINNFMQTMFKNVGIKLVDFKLEFGRINIDGKKEILLADEISPDTCRFWDVVSEKKLDKDRFRKDLGNLIQAYQLIWIFSI